MHFYWKGQDKMKKIKILIMAWLIGGIITSFFFIISKQLRQSNNQFDMMIKVKIINGNLQIVSIMMIC